MSPEAILRNANQVNQLKDDPGRWPPYRNSSSRPRSAKFIFLTNFLFGVKLVIPKTLVGVVKKYDHKRFCSNFKTILWPIKKVFVQSLYLDFCLSVVIVHLKSNIYSCSYTFLNKIWMPNMQYWRASQVPSLHMYSLTNFIFLLVFVGFVKTRTWRLCFRLGFLRESALVEKTVKLLHGPGFSTTVFC